MADLVSVPAKRRTASVVRVPLLSFPQPRKPKKVIYSSGSMPSRRSRAKIECSPRQIVRFWHSMMRRTEPASEWSIGKGSERARGQLVRLRRLRCDTHNLGREE